MTGRFLGTVLAMLVITTTLAYNSHVSWRVSMQEMRNQQSELIYSVLEACGPEQPCAVGDDLIHP